MQGFFFFQIRPIVGLNLPAPEEIHFFCFEIAAPKKINSVGLKYSLNPNNLCEFEVKFLGVP
jgi:hypothetical protein